MLSGEGGDRNYKLGIILLESSAIHGNKDSAGVLADMYEKCLCDCPLDLQKSKHWREIEMSTISRPYSLLDRGEKIKLSE